MPVSGIIFNTRRCLVFHYLRPEDVLGFYYLRPEGVLGFYYLVVKLTEHGTASLDPVRGRFLCGQQHGQHKVCGVTGGGQHALPLTGLVHGTFVPVV